MIVRINQLDPAHAETDSGWALEGPSGPLRSTPSGDLRAFELLILDQDEQGRPLFEAFRQSQLRQMIPPALMALRELGEEIIVRLDGPLTERALLPACRWLMDAGGSGRFALSGVQKLDDRPIDPPGSIRLHPSPGRLAGLCADTSIGLEQSVRLRAFAVPSSLVNSFLTLAAVDDGRWDDLLPQAGGILSTTRGLRSLQLWTRRFDAATIKSRVMQRLIAMTSAPAMRG